MYKVNFNSYIYIFEKPHLEVDLEKAKEIILVDGLVELLLELLL